MNEPLNLFFVVHLQIDEDDVLKKFGGLEVVLLLGHQLKFEQE